MRRPPGVELLAVVRVHARDGRATVRDVGEVAGLRSTSTVHEHLKALRSQGLVAWDEARTGTLRPLVVAVPCG